MPTPADILRISTALSLRNPNNPPTHAQVALLLLNAREIRRLSETECNRSLRKSEEIAQECALALCKSILLPFDCHLGQHFGLNVNIGAGVSFKSSAGIICEAIDCL